MMPQTYWFTHSVFVGLMLIAICCTSTSGTRVSLDKPTIDSIRTIAVIVQKEEDFSVIKSREQKSNVGAFMFGLVGAAVEHAAAASSDRGLRNDVLPMLGDYQPDVIFAAKLKEALLRSKKFAAVEDFIENTAPSPTTATITVVLKEWGLRPCFGSGLNEQLQVGLHIESKLMKADSAAPLWERDELYLNHVCHPLNDYQSRETLLRNSIAQAVTDLAAKTANEIVYP